MDRAALIEQLAEVAYDSDALGWQDDITFWQLGESTKAQYREEVAPYLPLIVAFVSRWLDEHVFPTAANYWREEMS